MEDAALEAGDTSVIVCFCFDCSKTQNEHQILTFRKTWHHCSYFITFSGFLQSPKMKLVSKLVRVWDPKPGVIYITFFQGRQLATRFRMITEKVFLTSCYRTTSMQCELFFYKLFSDSITILSHLFFSYHNSFCPLKYMSLNSKIPPNNCPSCDWFLPQLI